MPPPLTYLALKLVLEYLEANKRYQITSRNSAIQKIDNAIPLRAANLAIWKLTVSLDNLKCNTDYKQTYANWKIGQLIKKYLEGRPNIHVDRVGFYNGTSYEQVPLKLNLITNKLETFCCSDFRNFLPMIDSRSFPLKKLILTQEETIEVDHPVVHTTEDVIFQFSGQNELITGIEKLQREKLIIRNIKNGNVDAVRIIKDWGKNGKKIGTEYLLCSFSYAWMKRMMSDLKREFNEFEKLIIQNIMRGNVDAVRIIKDWIRNGRKIGTEYLLCFPFNKWIQAMLKNLEGEFNEFQNNLEGINVRFLNSWPRFSIPMSPASKIIIYGTRIQKDQTFYQLVLKVVSTDEL